jgi:uncharacterized protein
MDRSWHVDIMRTTSTTVNQHLGQKAEIIMTLTLDENRAAYQIRSYQPGQIQINDKIYQHSVIVAPHVLIEHWQPSTIMELKASDLNSILNLKPTILIIGTGEKLTFPPIGVYGDLINQGIGVEIMDTRAACRTYNALTSEDRNVVAALLIK